MADYQILKESVATVIKNNGNQEITGDLLQSTLFSMINSLGSGYAFGGVADMAVIPGTPDAKIFYIAAGPGTYDHFNNLVVNPGELAVFFMPGGGYSWYKQSVSIAGNGFALYGEGRYQYGHLPAIPTIRGKYYITVWRIASNVYYEYLYTSDSQVNGGTWTSVRQIGRINIVSGESGANSRPALPSTLYLNAEIKRFFNGCYTMLEGTVFSGGIPSSWTGTKAQLIATGFISEQDLETLETVATNNLPWFLSIDKNFSTEKLTLLYRYSEQGLFRLIFGGLDGDDYGTRMTFIIGDSHEGNDDVSFVYEHYQD